MDLMQKLEILADAAKYDVACTSSGVQRSAQSGQLGSSRAAGCCHSFTPDGRCISLLKVLMTNICIYDCAYCTNRRSNERKRCAFTPRELADLTMEFYRRNYIEGLFLSSGVLNTPDYTTELMIQSLEILRFEYRFNGYIHAKTVPGTAPELIDQLAVLADRLSVNLELPSQESLKLLAPQKSRQDILVPMKRIAERAQASKEDRALARRRTTVYAGHARAACLKRRGYAPAGQSTQLIVGATPENDLHILNLAEALYRSVSLKRVFFSAYLPVNHDERLPDTDAVQLDREHRLYQADWLLRFYRFDVAEIIDEAHPFLETDIDPKANWALNHLDLFPIEVNTAPYEMLLRVPGIGVRGAKLIVGARRTATLHADNLRKLGIAYKRARYFLTCSGVWGGAGCTFSKESLHAKLAAPIDGGAHGKRAARPLPGQLSLFGSDASAQTSKAIARRPGALTAPTAQMIDDSGGRQNASRPKASCSNASRLSA